MLALPAHPGKTNADTKKHRSNVTPASLRDATLPFWNESFCITDQTYSKSYMLLYVFSSTSSSLLLTSAFFSSGFLLKDS